MSGDKQATPTPDETLIREQIHRDYKVHYRTNHR